MTIILLKRRHVITKSQCLTAFITVSRNKYQWIIPNKYRLITHRRGNPCPIISPFILPFSHLHVDNYSYPSRFRLVLKSGFWKETQNKTMIIATQAAIFQKYLYKYIIYANPIESARCATLRKKNVIDNGKCAWCNIKYLLTLICKYFPKGRSKPRNQNICHSPRSARLWRNLTVIFTYYIIGALIISWFVTNE